MRRRRCRRSIDGDITRPDFQVFIKSELKVGVIYVKENQFTEEHILDNNENSPMFDEFLQVLGDKSRLRGFDKYKGGLDTVHDLTGTKHGDSCVNIFLCVCVEQERVC